MKATQYVGNKEFKVIEKQKTEPLADEVRIKVAYCGICGTDVHIYRGMMDKRVSIPQIIGHEMSGEIDAVGANVKDFKIGEKVVVRPLDNRLEEPSDKGLSHIAKKLKFVGIDSEGAMQEFWNVPAFTLHKLPDNIDLKLAALIEPLAVACHDVRRSGIKAGEFATILGGGPIGMLVSMVARAAGARLVISEVNPVRIELAKKMGFDVINPKEQDLVAHVAQLTNDYMADVAFEVAGVQSSLDIMTEVVGLRGKIVGVAIHGQPKLVNLFKFFWKELTFIGARVYEKQDYEKAISLVAENKLPLEHLITSVKPLSQIQQLFKEIDSNPSGMKFMLNCQE